MVRLKPYHKYKLKASTLVEVLIALVILLTVFAMGMLIYANLQKSASNKKRMHITLQLQAIAARYQLADWDHDHGFIQEQISYNVAKDFFLEYQDRTRVKIYAYDMNMQLLLDSLILIVERYED